MQYESAEMTLQDLLEVVTEQAGTIQLLINAIRRLARSQNSLETRVDAHEAAMETLNYDIGDVWEAIDHAK